MNAHVTGTMVGFILMPKIGRRAFTLLAIIIPLFSLATGLCGGAENESSPAQIQSPSDGRDVYGDSLPSGAIARLGTVRYRQSRFSAPIIAFLPDGETLMGGAVDGKLRALNVISGKTTREIDLSDYSFQAFCLSSDGKQIATLSRQLKPETREVQVRLSIRDTESWREQRQFDWKDSIIEAPQQLAISPDGKVIALGARSGTVRLHDAESGQELQRENAFRGEVASLAYSPDGEILAAAGNQGVALWQPRKDKPQKLPGSEQGGQVVRFSPDGSRLAVGSMHDKAALVYDVPTRQLLRQLNGKSQHYYRQDICFSSDGKLLVVPEAKSCEVYDVDSGRLTRSFDAGNGKPGYVAISADGRFLACTGSDSAMVIWDMQTGERLSDRFVGHLSAPSEIAFTPDGQRVVTGGMDGTIRIWDAATGQQVRMLTHDRWVAALALSPRGDRLASCGFDDTVRLWDVAAGKELFHLDGHGKTGGSKSTEVAFSPDGERFYSFGGDMYLRSYDATNGRVVAEHQLTPTGAPADRSDDGTPRRRLDPRGPAFPDQALLAADTTVLLMGGRRTGEIYTFDIQTGQELDVFRPDDALQDYAISPDGKLLVTFEQPARKDPDQNARRQSPPLRIRDFASKQVVREINLPGFYGYQIAFSPDSRFMAVQVAEAATDGRRKNWIRVWDIGRLREIAQIECDATWGLAFSHDTTKLTTSHHDSSVIVWDLARFVKEYAAPQ